MQESFGVKWVDEIGIHCWVYCQYEAQGGVYMGVEMRLRRRGKRQKCGAGALPDRTQDWLYSRAGLCYARSGEGLYFTIRVPFA